jgi:pimeloyl-ACP methyl ester carboxylesterase
VPDGVRARTNAAAVSEDRAYTGTQDPHERWSDLTMPTLLLRATKELRTGSGYVVPATECDLFRQRVSHAVVVEVDANHLTINTHQETLNAVERFLDGVLR